MDKNRHANRIPGNSNELRLSLLEVYQGILDGNIQPSVADAAVNAAGKVIALAKVELEYAFLRKEAPTLPFLLNATNNHLLNAEG